MITVIVDPIGLGRFRASLGDRVLCESRTPLLGAARVLLAEGVDPATPLAMRHRTSDTIAMRSTVGAAARLSVDEYGPRFVPYREMTVEAITEARLSPPADEGGASWDELLPPGTGRRYCYRHLAEQPSPDRKPEKRNEPCYTVESLADGCAYWLDELELDG